MHSSTLAARLFQHQNLPVLDIILKGWKDAYESVQLNPTHMPKKQKQGYVEKFRLEQMNKCAKYTMLSALEFALWGYYCYYSWRTVQVMARRSF